MASRRFHMQTRPTSDHFFISDLGDSPAYPSRSISSPERLQILPPDFRLRLIASAIRWRRAKCCSHRCLRDRGDENIGSVADLLAKSVSYDRAPIAGVTAPPKGQIEGATAVRWRSSVGLRTQALAGRLVEPRGVNVSASRRTMSR
jgi:hypothetical protein